MAWIYLVRHAQASFLTEDYDRLSDAGRVQARLLGQEFAKCGIRFDYAISGSLLRQQQTAAHILEASGSERLPEVEERPGLNEFFPEVWTGIAKELAREDHSLRPHLLALKNNDGQPPAAKWDSYLTLTVAILSAWVEHRFPDLEIESFAEFTERVYSSMIDLPGQEETKILVVSSSTPTSLLIGRGMGLSAPDSLRFMRWLYNTSWSLLHITGTFHDTVSFNDFTHLQPTQVTLI